MKTASLLVCLAASISNSLAVGEEKPDPKWYTPEVPFRVLAITSNGSSLWANGTDEGIAVSSDAGVHWQVKHKTPDGNLLLSIQFANERFGYAAGTEGLILTTGNGGERWTPRSAESATVRQTSLFDPLHGLLRTGRLQAVSSSWSDAKSHPSCIFAAQAAPSPGCSQTTTIPNAAFGGLMNAVYGNFLTLNRSYDTRLRLISENDTRSATSTPGPPTQSAPSIIVGQPTADANGVKYYPVTSVYQGSKQQTIRVLEPTNPAPGKPRRILFVLPVDAGVDTTSSTWSDGLEELRLLDVQNRFNMTLIAPSFNYEPWFGDNVTDPTLRMESFIIDDLVPFGDRFAQGSVPQRYLIGFSKSGNGVLFLILRHPFVFNAAAAWDAPAQLNDISAFSMLPTNFGKQANYKLYNIPSLVSTNAQPFLQQNRLWISGDQASWTADMDQLNDQMRAASMLHTWVAGETRVHSWNSGWLDGAVTNLDANATLAAPVGGAMAPPRTGSLPAGGLLSGTTQATLSLITDEAATCRYATTAGVAYSSMTNTFSVTGGTAHSTAVTGLQDGGNYNYYVRCQDTASQIANPDDYSISFAVVASARGATSTSSSTFMGTEDPLSENGMWGTTGSWTSLKKNNGAYSTNTTSGARLLTPLVGPDQYAEITFDQHPGTEGWPGVMTRIQGTNKGSCYLATASSEQVKLYRIDDAGYLNFTLLASANASLGTTPRDLRLESQGSTHRVYFSGALLITYTDPNNIYTTGQPGISDAIFGGHTVRILSFAGGTLASGSGSRN